jgi:hypothetical protein
MNVQAVWSALMSVPMLVAASLTASAADPQAFVVPLFPRPPTIDGRIDAEEWRSASGFEGLTNVESKLLDPRKVQAWIGADEDHLYLAMKSQLPDEGNLLAAVTSDSTKIVFDDSLEIYVNPTPDAPDRVDYQFLGNVLGHAGYNLHKIGNPREDESWRGDWKTSSAIHDGHWHFECAIPIASMGTTAPGRKTTDGAWAINFTRNWRPDWAWTAISEKGYPNSGLRFVFVKDRAPGVTMASTGILSFPPSTLALSVFNPGGAAMDLKAAIDLTRNNMPAIKETRELRLGAGSGDSLGIKLDVSDPTTIYELQVRVASADGATTFYERSTKWTRARERPRWVTGKPQDAPLLDFSFAYYPTRNAMRIAADINGLPAEAKPDRVVVLVRKAGGGQTIKEVAFPLAGFTDGRQEIRLDLPPLEGDYEIVMTASGENVPKCETAKAFERRKFPWESSSSGLSTRVFPPFTPIQVAGKRLLTVLKAHDLNDFGLVDQIVATSANTRIAKPVLAAPMTYSAKADGLPLSLRAETLRTVAVADHEATFAGGFADGPLRISFLNTWDYDGTVKVQLTLAPTGGKAIDELTLDIPFPAASATMIHANADRIRAPVARSIPTAQGIVWDGSKVACDDFIRNFCPYVYIGNAVRGLCWFAENDKGWGWDPRTPNMTLSREGGTVVLRIHLVNQPTVIDQERTLTFGLLAAPVKPPLNPDGESPHWWRHRYLRDGYRLLGTDINWLALGDCGSVYPAGRDMYLWEMLKRGNREQLSDAEVESVVERGKPYFEPYGQEKVDSFVMHARGNLRAHAGNKKMVFYYNRASCQLFDEFETFKDEWSLDDMRVVGKGIGIGEIKVVPTRSYVDYNLHWYIKSFELGGNVGVYWDNWFIVPSFNTEMTDAYRRADGSIAPAAGIWQLRELCKRTFVMMNEQGMLPFVFPHMTSFNPLPMMSFATAQYDWEWKYSEGDVQDRHGREYLLLASTGELAGVWPVPLHDHGPKESDPWEQRTFAAVRIVHELDGVGGWGHDWVDAHRENRKRLAEPVLDMLRKDGVMAYKYWEDRPLPVRTGSPDLPAIVYAVPGKEALVAVVSYTRSDVDVDMAVDARALGLANPVAVDVETGVPLKMTGNRLSFPLKKHDIKMIRLTQP